MSESTLMTALLAFQAEVPRLTKDSTAKVTSQKTGGSYTYKFIELDSIIESIRPLLIKHGLVWRTFPCSDEQGRPALRYRLTHAESGQQEEDVMPLAIGRPDDPQVQGSAITYARRYAVTAVLDLQVGGDDDGAAAKRRAGSAQVPNGNGGARVSAPVAQQTEQMATAKQRGLINGKAAEKGLPPITLANIVLAASEAEIRDFDSQSEAEGWLRRALDRLPGRLVTPVLAGIDHADPEDIPA